MKLVGSILNEISRFNKFHIILNLLISYNIEPTNFI